jgi:hypothetical protein
MKIIKLFVIHILLLSSFQTFAAFFITTPNVSTPENRDKVIKLTVNTGKRDAPSFRILDGADNDWFDIDDDELTFKATAFRAQKDNMGNMKSPIIKVNLGYGYSNGFDRRHLEFEFGLIGSTHIY